MRLTLNRQIQALIEQRVKSGTYATAQDVVLAGLGSLKEDETFGDFEPGELDELIAEGERSLKEHGPVPADQVFQKPRR